MSASRSRLRSLWEESPSFYVSYFVSHLVFVLSSSLFAWTFWRHDPGVSLVRYLGAAVTLLSALSGAYFFAVSQSHLVHAWFRGLSLTLLATNVLCCFGLMASHADVLVHATVIHVVLTINIVRDLIGCYYFRPRSRMWNERYRERLSHGILIWMLYALCAYGMLLLQRYYPQFQLITNLSAENIAIFLDGLTLMVLAYELLGFLKYSMMNANLNGADEDVLSVEEGYQHWSKSYATGNGVIAVERELTSLNLEFHNFNNKSVLDFGCGIGHYTQKLLSFNANVIAIDANKFMLEEFYKGISTKSPQCQIIHGGVEALTKIPLNSLDAVIACLVIDHLADSQLEAFFRLSFGILKKGGSIYITDVNPYFEILSHRYAKFVDQDGIESRIMVEPHPIPEVIERIAGAGFQRLQVTEGKVSCKEALKWVDLHGIEGFPLIIGYKAVKPN